jgi:SAM-dependent methyltransferase
MPAMITGERATVADGGFNPSFQRHVACYRLCAALLPEGRLLDLGCGVGHSWRELAPRETVGVDIAPEALAGQDRETHVADMRRLPFADGSFDSVMCSHAIEHVPDPGAVLAEVVRVLRPGGRAAFVTPNRLTFGRPDEIIDPYHYVEYDPLELRRLCEPWFRTVEILGIHGSDRHLALVAAEHRRLDRLLSRDPLRLRRLVPRRARQLLYDAKLTRSRAAPLPGALQIVPEDFRLDRAALETALDLVAIGDRH